MRGAKSKDVLVRSVNLIWYPVTLAPILALFFAAAYGYLPGLFALLALFLCFFWLSSLGFALYAKLTKPKDPRQ